MGKISKKSAKKIRTREQHDALHTSESFEGSTSTPPTQLPKFPDINVWQEAANYYRAYQLRTAPTSVVEPPANKLPIPAPRITYDPETVSLEDLDRAHIRFVQDLLRAGTPITEAIYDLMDKLRSRVEIREAGVSLACLNQAVTDLWWKVARKAAKIAYQHEYYGNILRTPVLTQSRVQPVTTTATTTITAPATATSAALETPTTDSSSTATASLTAVVTPETGNEGIGGKRRDERVPAPVRTADKIACKPKRFDWATEIDESIGPVPSVSDFRPTTPPAPINCPTAPMSPRDAPAPVKPVRTPRTAAAPITNETASRANVTRVQASPAKPSTIGHSKESSAPSSPLASPQPTPSPCARDLPSSSQRGHVTALKHRALPKPAVTPSSDDVAPCAHTPAPTAPRAVNPSNSDVTLRGPSPATPTPVALRVRTPVSSDGPTTPLQPVHPPSAPTIAPSGGDVAHRACTPTPGALTAPCTRTLALSKDPPITRVVRQPRDLTGLHSDTPNPWGSLSRRHKYSRPP